MTYKSWWNQDAWAGQNSWSQIRYVVYEATELAVGRFSICHCPRQI